MAIDILSFLKAIKRRLNNSKALQFLNLSSYLLVKLGDFSTNSALSMKRNLETIIHYSHSRSTTDLSAIMIAVKA
jgi:hypothetical protein